MLKLDKHLLITIIRMNDSMQEVTKCQEIKIYL